MTTPAVSGVCPDAQLARVESLVRGNLAGCSGEAVRLFHGRGRTVKNWEQVAIDYFRPVVLITLFEYRDRAWLDTLRDRLLRWTRGHEVSCIAVQSRHARGAPLQVIHGELPRKPLALESGLRYALQFGGRQNIGFFLDMACARRWLCERAEGARVLNLFAYTCAFSVVARSRGARQVVNLDMSSAALRQGQQNHQRNGLHGGVSYLAHKLSRSWSKLRRMGPFDLLIVDPPSRQPGSFVAESDYEGVIAHLESLCAPGAQLLLCLNSPHLGTDFLCEQVAAHAPRLIFDQRLPNPPQFAEADPQRGLKVLSFRYCESR